VDGLKPPAPAPSVSHTVHTPTNIQLIGDELAIAWSDGAETYHPGKRLRAASPRAEHQGARDIFGQPYGGAGPRHAPRVPLLGLERIGNYALRFEFSDGHRTGLYSFDYLRALAARDAGSGGA